jgi:hypothetical protein
MRQIRAAILPTLAWAATSFPASASDFPAMGRDRPMSMATAYNWTAAGTLGTVLAGTGLAALSDGSGGAANLGVGLILVGLGVGPSAGQFYAGSYYHGIAATTLRGLGAVLVVAGAAESAPGGCSERSSEGTPCRDRGIPIALAGSLAYFGGVAYSLVDTHNAVRRRNSASRLSLAPSLGTARQGGLQPGLHAQVRF